MRLWDAESGKARSPVLREHACPVRAADFSGDGRLLATADASGQGLLWDVATGRILSRLPPILVLLAGIDFSPDATRVALGGVPDNGVQDGRWRSVGEREFSLGRRLERTSPSALTARFSPWRADGGLVDVWDVASRQRRHSLMSPGATPIALSFSRDGGTLAAGNTDGTTVVWDLETGQAVGQPLAGLRGAVEHVTIDDDASHITTASATGVASWDLQGTALSTHRSLGPSPVGLLIAQSVAFSPDGHHVATIGFDGQLSIRDGVTLSAGRGVLPTGAAQVLGHAVAFSPDGRFVVAGAGSHLSALVHGVAFGLPPSSRRRPP